MKKLRVGIVGVGHMGRYHTRTYKEIAGIELVAIADKDERYLKKIANEFSIAQTYTDYREMVQKERLDLVSICVPTLFHKKVSIFCIKNGIHVLLEKPIAFSLQEGREIIAMAEKSGVLLYIGHVERFNPAVRKLKEMVDRNEFGRISSIVARRVGGPPLKVPDADVGIDLAIHDADLANFLLGEIPKKIVAYRHNNHLNNKSDSVEFFLRYSHASVYIQANWITPVKIRQIQITGTKGYAEANLIDQTITHYKMEWEDFKKYNGSFTDLISRFANPKKKIITCEKKQPLKEEICYFIDCVKRRDFVNNTFSLDALKIVLSK